LEASGGSLPTRGRASRCDRESVGGLRQDGLEAPHGALLSTRRKPIGRREGRVGRPGGRREPSTGGDGSMSACRLDDSTGGSRQATQSCLTPRLTRHLKAVGRPHVAVGTLAIFDAHCKTI
jgi:hypothetical protein